MNKKTKLTLVLCLSIIPTLCLANMLNNIFITQEEGTGMFLFTLFTFSFCLSLVLSAFYIKIIDLENKLVELNKKLNDEKDNN